MKASFTGARGGVLSAVGGVAGWTLISRILGFVRWLIQAATVGAGTIAGAYATANQVPNILYEVVVGGALAATVVPLLAGAIAGENPRSVERTASGLLGLVLLLLCPAALVVMVLAHPIAALFPTSAGADPGLQHDLVAAFLRMFALQIPLYGVGVVLTGVLQAHGRFIWPTLTPIASSLVVGATYLVYGQMTAGAHDAPSCVALAVLGWGTTAGVAALSLPLLWPVRRLGVHLRPTVRLPRSQLRRATRLGGAGLWTLVPQQASVVAVLALARMGGQTGTVAVYQYTQAVYVLPYAVLAVPVATVLYPRLAQAFESQATAGAKAEYGGDTSSTQESDRMRRRGRIGEPSARAIQLTAVSTALVVAVSLAGMGALIAVSNGAEAFFSVLTHVEGMSRALVALAPGLVGYALMYQVTRVMFAADRASGAAMANGVGWLAVVVFSVLGVHLMAPNGGDGPATLVALGLALTGGMSVAGLGLMMVLARCVGGRALWPSIRVLLVCAPIALVAGWCVRYTTAALTGVPLSLRLVVAVAGAALVAACVIAAALVTHRGLLAALRTAAHRDEAA